MANQVLKVVKDTLLKRQPEQSHELPDDQLYTVESGTVYPIHSYAWADDEGNFNEHVRFALKDDNINGFNTWYVFNRDIEVEFDGKLVYPWEEQTAIQILRITEDTVVKRRPVDASELTDEEKHEVKDGMTFELHSYAWADASGEFNDHIRFAIGDRREFINGLSTWYVDEKHAQVEFDDDVVYPLPEARNRPVPAGTPASSTASATAASASKTFSGPTIDLPGHGTVYLAQPIIPNGNFNWAEATKNGSRIPRTKAEVDNILALAKPLQQAREQLGRSFRVTSWYRPEPFNSRVGGARRSQHLGGRAADLVVSGMNGRQVARELIAWWPGGVGTYAGNRSHIIHLDVGPRRKWGF
ncbi:YcbK family protein [Vacuolonema iberomarrocanum]|uniref:YcbK family protein n=1 Tax=Vacuolonema iberomarrocanum TaxID=3454632 RepID=UPI0019E6C452|nr:DUF882 domain-containing protein [filamentous cyanobacterium LEGE 07170]